MGREILDSLQGSKVSISNKVMLRGDLMHDAYPSWDNCTEEREGWVRREAQTQYKHHHWGSVDSESE